MSEKYVYFFGNGKADGNTGMRDKLGGKGADLAEMTNLGIPVPPGFTITTDACTFFMESGGSLPDGLQDEVRRNVAALEAVLKRSFADSKNPLLVSVRSGARKSMPGMMDTVLNLGLNDDTVQGLAAGTSNPRFAYDSYRRFIQMYADVVMGVDSESFEELLEARKKKAGVSLDFQLGPDDLKSLVHEYKDLVKKVKKVPFPDDPEDQLWGAIAAVFKSWNNKRAIAYRKIHGFPDDWGTAVNIQAMVFGNMGDTSATGVAFTRDPATGHKQFYGEYLFNAQGEDVVAGIRTPLPINDTSGAGSAENSLQNRMPDLYRQLVEIYQKLEKHYKDMQDIEFTIQDGTLWLLQTRTGKRTGRAAVKIAVDMVKEGLIGKETAVKRVEPSQLEQLLHPTIDPNAKTQVLAKGLPASPGAASGKVAFTVEDTLEMAGKGDKVILVRVETSPEDIEGMKAAEAILTARGGMTSHAAVVARGMGKCCVVGCSDLVVDYGAKHFKVGKIAVQAGDHIALNGTTGTVYLGNVPTVDAALDEDFSTFMEWVDAFRKLGVRANADTPQDAENARRFGAAGIGLARTEHMFFGEDRILLVRRMITASSREERLAALREILPMQRDDFVGVFKAMDGYPVTIRLLDPPLHEFLPHTEEEIGAVARTMGLSLDALREKVEALREFNPMLGHRGCRLGITYPEIYEMQVQAIVEAACIASKMGVDVKPEIMIPLVGVPEELSILRSMTIAKADEILSREGVTLPYLVGTMIEVPRAAIVADAIAAVADFFSFGTNDLTQMTFGYSRDDSGKFLNAYIEHGVLRRDPFESLDTVGVGALVRMAVEKGKRENSKLKVGICGEHGGDPDSIRFFHEVGLNYVSCSPFRVPVARLAAAHAALAG
jgi:pyruvate,orthophosphate dikinase